MYTNLNQILEITKHNVYSKAITNHIHHHTKDEDLKNYLALVKSTIEGIPSLSEIDSALEKCENIGIKYLLLSFKLGMARITGEEAICKKIYRKLLREYDHIPLSCRKGVARELKLHSAYHEADATKIFRTWSQKHLEDAYDQTFDTLQNTLKLFSKSDKNLSEAFYNIFQEALTKQQQNLILPALNNAVWVMKDKNRAKAVEMASELGYYSGYYDEDSHKILPGLDTQLNIAKLNDDYELFFEYAQIMNDYFEKYAKPFKYLRELYQPSVKMARQYALVHKKRTLKSDEIANGKSLRNFLSERIRKPNAFATQHGISHASLYRILNGERRAIKICTLKKIVESLDLEYSFKHPRDINYILKASKEEALFEEHSEKIGGMPSSEISEMLLRGIFISPPFEKTNMIKLLSLREDPKRLLDYMKGDYSCKTFINRCFNEKFSFYRGRTDLLNKFIEVLGGKIAISKLTTRYSTLKSNEEIDLLNRYFRAYAWGKTMKIDFDLEAVLEKRFSDPDYERITCFCEKLNLSELDGYLCTWFFEGKERERLLKIITPAN